jgi:hypothetical protein
LEKDDIIAFYDADTGKWKKVKITSRPNKRKGWKDWFNYVDEEGDEGGGYFREDERWTFLENNVDDVAALGIIAQVDGTDIPDSATPDTTPEKETDQPQLLSATGARPKVRLATSQYLSSSSDSDTETHHVPSLNDALDWDNYGTDLECSVLCEDPPSRMLAIPLDQAINLDSVLPLTSTPVASPLDRARRCHERSRVSAPRRQLPEEVDRKEASFLAQLNPFRKKR